METAMKRLLVSVLLALAACTNGDGERCNPLRATTDCDPGLTCVYPTGPMCGVAFCCTVDTQGNITDRHPNCQADPGSAAACMLDLGGAIDSGAD
jgi:hypothetical protein